MQTNNKMAVAPVGKLIWQMSIPPLISMFLQYSYNLIDSAFVARLSEKALIAVSLAFPITTLMNAASIWIGVGVTVGALAVIKAQAYVKANTPDAARAFVFGPDQDHVGMRTLEGLVNEFNATRRAREAELNQHYIDRAAR